MHSNGKIHIRLANESDVKNIADIVKQSFTQYCNMIGIDAIEALLETEQDVLKDLRQKSVYVACWEKNPVGSIRIAIKSDKASVSRFAIKPEYQGLGIGSDMLSFAEKTLEALKIETIELYSATENCRLKNFYLSKGYQVVSIDNSKGYRRGLFRKHIYLNK
ncbi:MAG: GNAT family N-acetyltransferase [Clostridiales bacterium]|jgi:ribosomal protein S18 acetylase RimI-like enzyme|nr:GNAT family N-acetyltransferase [Clostridiales bacterium]